jgi:integrase/recombinase XerD
MGTTALAVAGETTYQGILPQDTNDVQLVELWLRGKDGGTKIAYERDCAKFLAFVGKPLRLITLQDMYDYQESLSHLSRATVNRRLAVVKSLLSFGSELGYLAVNVGRAVKLEQADQDRAARIITEADMLRMIDREPSKRNHALLHLMYHAGLRVSEVVGLRWSEVVARDSGAQISILGKGKKRRYILISQGMVDELLTLPHMGEYVFSSRQSDSLTIDMVSKIVHAAASRVGLSKEVSAHWLRHSHASHALDHNAPVHLVQETLGHKSLATTSIYSHARPGASSSQYLLV